VVSAIASHIVGPGRDSQPIIPANAGLPNTIDCIKRIVTLFAPMPNGAPAISLAWLQAAHTCEYFSRPLRLISTPKRFAGPVFGERPQEVGESAFGLAKALCSTLVSATLADLAKDLSTCATELVGNSAGLHLEGGDTI
jgi:hypothetical protein